MNRSFKLKAVLFFAIACMFSVLTTKAQDAKKPPASPRDSVSSAVNGATITINYGSPSVRDRKIYGGLVPYDSVWRTGANAATTITFSKDVVIEGKPLTAGKYGFFAIPGKKSWVIIFNSVADQWGAFKYDATKDVLRVTVKPKTVAKSERLVYTIDAKGFALTWDTLTVPVKVK